MPLTKATQNVVEGIVSTGSTGVSAGSFVVGQQYKITSLGTTTQSQWNTIAGTTGQTYVVGSLFTAATTGASSGNGAAAVARTLANRFGDVVNVKDFGAVGTGAVDDRAAIQAAIDASYGNTLFFPDGTYLIGSSLYIRDTIKIVCGYAFIAGNDHDGIVISTGVPNTQVSNVSIEGLVLFKNPNSTTLTRGIYAFNAEGVKLQNVSILNYPVGLELQGCNNCGFFQVSTPIAFGQTTNVANSAGLIISDDGQTSIGPWGFTHQFVNCFITSSFKRNFCAAIYSGDVSYFSNCYFGAGTIANIFIENKNTTVNAAKSFDNCYIDGVHFPTPSTPATIYGIWLKNDGLASPSMPIINFRNCHIGQNYIGALIDEPSTYQISFNNCELFNCWESGILCTSSETDIRINGCSFNNIGTVNANGEAILIRDGKSINITSNIFRVGDNPPVATFYGIKLEGTIEQVCIDGNCFLGIPNDYNSTATVNQLLIADNISNNPTNTIVGSIIGNQANSNPKSLDWYEETTFSPTISFGGASVGVTYSSRSGSLTRIGNRVLVNIYIALSNKGTSTGTVLIGTLPFAVNNSFPAQFTVLCTSMNASIGSNNLFAGSSGTTIGVGQQVSGSSTDFNDTHFTNSSLIIISGTYQVA